MKKVDSNKIKLIEKNYRNVVSSTPLRWTKPKQDDQNAAKITFLDFYWNLSYNWVELIFSRCLFFLKPPWWQFWTVWTQELKALSLVFFFFICHRLLPSRQCFWKDRKRSFVFACNTKNFVIAYVFVFAWNARRLAIALLLFSISRS